jgi:hypothetical protein
VEEDIAADDSTPSALRNTYWRDTIYCAVSRLYFCETFFRRRKGLRFYAVVGRPRNIAIVHYVAQYLIRTGEELAKQGAKDAARPLAAEGIELNTRAWAASFRIGFAQRIEQRVTEEINKAKRGEIKDETGTALILSPLYDREKQAITTHMSNLKFGTQRYGVSVRSTSGYQAGREAGNRANLASSGVTSRSSAKSLPAA